MRVIFVGNVWDYSPGYLAALARRSADPADPLRLQAVVCPMKRASGIGGYWSAAKRDLDAVMRLWPQGMGPQVLREKLSAYRSGFSRQMRDLAREAGARISWPRSLSEPDALENLRALKADLLIVAGLNQILPEHVVRALPPIFNIHPSLLPDFRGAAPEYWQLDAGVTRGGVTIHRIDAGVDTGPIALQRPMRLEPWLDADALLAKSVQVGIALMNEFLDAYPTVSVRQVAQSEGSYQPVPKLKEQSLPLDRSAQGVFNRARAVGFRNPLFVHVPRREWIADRMALGSTVPSAETVPLGLYDAMAFAEQAEGSPRLLRQTGGSVVLTCQQGSVLFRRAAFSREIL